MGTPPAYKRVEHKDRKTSSINHNNDKNNENNNDSSNNKPDGQSKKNSSKSILGLSPIPNSEADNPKKPRVAMPTGKTEESKSDRNKFSMRKEKKPAAPLPDYLARHVTPSPDYPLLPPAKTTTTDYPLLPPRTTPSPDYLADRTIPSPDYLSSRCKILPVCAGGFSEMLTTNLSQGFS